MKIQKFSFSTFSVCFVSFTNPASPGTRVSAAETLLRTFLFTPQHFSEWNKDGKLVSGHETFENRRLVKVLLYVNVGFSGEVER